MDYTKIGITIEFPETNSIVIFTYNSYKFT